MTSLSPANELKLIALSRKNPTFTTVKKNTSASDARLTDHIELKSWTRSSSQRGCRLLKSRPEWIGSFWVAVSVLLPLAKTSDDSSAVGATSACTNAWSSKVAIRDTTQVYTLPEIPAAKVDLCRGRPVYCVAGEDGPGMGGLSHRACMWIAMLLMWKTPGMVT